MPLNATFPDLTGKQQSKRILVELHGFVADVDATLDVLKQKRTAALPNGVSLRPESKVAGHF